MSGISTHVLDLARGRPAAEVAVRLERRGAAGWQEISTTRTDADGRASALVPPGVGFVGGTYRLTFDLAGYFARHDVDGFFPEASLVFEVRDADQKHHVPLLLSPFGYSTYRGS